MIHGRVGGLGLPLTTDGTWTMVTAQFADRLSITMSLATVATAALMASAAECMCQIQIQTSFPTTSRTKYSYFSYALR